ncbi:hypothetical protein VTO42DRAFT_8793 [Malbranchea cinnamomea]
MSGVQKPVLALTSDSNRNGTPGSLLTGMDGEATNDFGSDPSRPPTPHGTGLPDNFGEVAPGIYRSSYPLPAHMESIMGLKLRTIITLVNEPLPAEYQKAMEENRITYHVIPIIPNKTPGICTPQSTIDKVIEILLNPENHPVLVHCNKGKHRTGCVIACFRRLQGWAADMAVAEYLRYAHPKARPLDQDYIKKYDDTVLAGMAEKVRACNWRPKTPDLGAFNPLPPDCLRKPAANIRGSLLKQGEGFCNGETPS